MPTRPPRLSGILIVAGFLGLTGVALGAMGAHALKATLLERGMLTAWETASRYHMFHALAVFAAAGWLHTGLPARAIRLFNWAAWAWGLGVVLFSGSLYWLALGGPRWLGPVTPLGGLGLMMGWLLVAIAGLGKRS